MDLIPFWMHILELTSSRIISNLKERKKEGSELGGPAELLLTTSSMHIADSRRTGIKTLHTPSCFNRASFQEDTIDRFSAVVVQ